MRGGDWIPEVVERLGGHPARALGLDLDRPEDRDRWLVAAALLSLRIDEAKALAAARGLAEAGLDTPAALAGDVDAVLARLAAHEIDAAEEVAHRLARLGRALVDCGGTDALARESDDLHSLGGRLVRLVRGIGASTVMRFLAPLRGRWSAAREVPLSAAARAAAVHLELLAPGEDEEGEPGALMRVLGAAPGAPDPIDVEAALDRLGRRACLRQRARRCPLGAACPLREVR
jgi:hypothetical protein